MVSQRAAEVWVRRYRDTAECDVVVVVREQTMVLRCRDYSQAVKWAKIECKSYKIPDDFTVELVATAEPRT
jgi:hypothetical protein